MAGRGDGSRSSFARFVKERTHSLWLAWRGAGLREAGKRTNFLSEPLSKNKLPKKSQEKCQPPAPPTPMVPALEQPVPRQRIGPFWSVSSGGNRLEKCKVSFQVPIPWMNRGSVAGTDITNAPLNLMGNIAFNE